MLRLKFNWKTKQLKQDWIDLNEDALKVDRVEMY